MYEPVIHLRAILLETSGKIDRNKDKTRIAEDPKNESPIDIFD